MRFGRAKLHPVGAPCGERSRLTGSTDRPPLLMRNGANLFTSLFASLFGVQCLFVVKAANWAPTECRLGATRLPIGLRARGGVIRKDHAPSKNGGHPRQRSGT